MQFSSRTEQMAWMFGRGHSLDAIGQHFDVCRETVRRCMISLGIDTNYHNRRSAEAKPYALMVSEMRACGIPWRTISDKIGFSERTLRRYSML